MRILILILSLTSLLIASSQSFSKSKKELRKVYQGHQIAFYSGCKYNYKDKKNMIDRNSCGYKPRNERTKKGNTNQRARRIEWEHIMPAQNFGRHLPCWKEGGRKHCRKVSKKFKTMEADMMNLVPAIGELNGDRSNYRYGVYEPQIGQYGSVLFQIDFKAKRAFIDPQIRGDVARIYFYMNETYNIPLSDQERKMMEVWDLHDPIDVWEIERMKRITRVKE